MLARHLSQRLGCCHAVQVEQRRRQHDRHFHLNFLNFNARFRQINRIDVAMCAPSPMHSPPPPLTHALIQARGSPQRHNSRLPASCNPKFKENTATSSLVPPPPPSLNHNNSTGRVGLHPTELLPVLHADALSCRCRAQRELDDGGGMGIGCDRLKEIEKVRCRCCPRSFVSSYFHEIHLIVFLPPTPTATTLELNCTPLPPSHCLQDLLRLDT
jgi:hypothetical protein